MGGTFIIAAWIIVVCWVGLILYLNKDKHPKGLFFLFMAELWERFSFYGMRALLVLYMIKHFLYSEGEAYGIYGAYGALVYGTPVFGGLIADKILGYRKGIMLGAILMALGHFAMAFESKGVFFSALALLIVGNGFFKPNISSLLGKLYPEGDSRRDAGFTIFYMGINVGAALAGITCGYLGEHPDFGWHYGFGLAGVGMALGLVLFWWSQKDASTYGDEGLPPSVKHEGENIRVMDKKLFGPVTLGNAIYLLAFATVPLFAVLVNFHESLALVVPGLTLIMLGYMVFVSLTGTKEEGQRIWVILILLVFTSLFWAFFEQAGTSMTMYADKNVSRIVFGNEIQTSQFQSLNPAYIMFLAPMFSFFWSSIGKKGFEPSAPTKFVLGLLQLALGFYMLVLGAQMADVNSKVGVLWLCLAYLFHTTGELCLSPIGLSLVTKLAPAKITGLVMGVWFLSSTVAHWVGGLVAKLTAQAPQEGVVLSAAEGLALYTDVFQSIAIITLGAAGVLALLVPVLKKWMHGVE